jgi:hypothetical protein
VWLLASKSVEVLALYTTDGGYYGQSHAKQGNKSVLRMVEVPEDSTRTCFGKQIGTGLQRMILKFRLVGIHL